MFFQTMLPVKLGHTPAGSSVRQFAHYGQGISDGHFRRYDHGSRTNRRLYGTRTPPHYPLDRITTPVFLHFSDQDPLAEVSDVQRLWRELGRPVGLFRIQQSTFSHLDFMWGIDARTLVYNRVINLLWSMNNNDRN